MDILTAIGRLRRTAGSGTNSPVSQLRSSPKSSASRSQTGIYSSVGVTVGSSGRVLVGIGVKVAAAEIGVGLTGRVDVAAGALVGEASAAGVVAAEVVGVGVSSGWRQLIVIKIKTADHKINLFFMFIKLPFVNLSSKCIIYIDIVLSLFPFDNSN